jgi:hypothetical protein
MVTCMFCVHAEFVPDFAAKGHIAVACDKTGDDVTVYSVEDKFSLNCPLEENDT